MLEDKAHSARELYTRIAADKQEKVQGGKPTAEDAAALMLSVEAIHMLDQVKNEPRAQTSRRYTLNGVEVDPGGRVHTLTLKLPTLRMGSEIAGITTVTKKIGRKIVFYRVQMGERNPDYGRETVAFKM